jgi:hypothetical protein
MVTYISSALVVGGGRTRLPMTLFSSSQSSSSMSHVYSVNRHFACRLLHTVWLISNLIQMIGTELPSGVNAKSTSAND